MPHKNQKEGGVNGKHLRKKHYYLFLRILLLEGNDVTQVLSNKDRARGNVAKTPAKMMEEQSHNQVDASDLGAENDVSPVNLQSQQSNQSASSQRKRKRATGSSSDGTEAIINGLKEFYVESAKRMQMVTEAIIRGTTDHSDIANELKAMGLSPMDQIDGLTLILEKPQNVGVFRSIDSELKKVFVQKLLSNKVSG
ncbi:uncharacterized protein LOC103951132 isoform X5 [Pyrus x bretschneideri]|uniref:uncharacterized protein LOC103951132 isoform X5 n=1 Tax=Pyrus x bretschneideri TaxID=225117 RepID=UPI00202EC922|nr:uncharacterized protein LOC103951132 isoform X5 [Pyrus x bretschneideri]